VGIRDRYGEHLFVRIGSGSGRQRSLFVRAAILARRQDIRLQHEGGELREMVACAIIMVGGAVGVFPIGCPGSRRSR
jgi:hypothetical protein